MGYLQVLKQTAVYAVLVEYSMYLLWGSIGRLHWLQSSWLRRRAQGSQTLNSQHFVGVLRLRAQSSATPTALKGAGWQPRGGTAAAAAAAGDALAPGGGTLQSCF